MADLFDHVLQVEFLSIQVDRITFQWISTGIINMSMWRMTQRFKNLGTRKNIKRGCNPTLSQNRGVSIKDAKIELTQVAKLCLSDLRFTGAP